MQHAKCLLVCQCCCLVSQHKRNDLEIQMCDLYPYGSSVRHGERLVTSWHNLLRTIHFVEQFIMTTRTALRY